jgi:hypothetical protein
MAFGGQLMAATSITQPRSARIVTRSRQTVVHRKALARGHASAIVPTEGVEMAHPELETSPQTYARIAGAIYLVTIAIGLSGEAFVKGKLIVAGNATATAMNIVASLSLWHVSVAAELAYLIGAVVSTWIFYLLLKPVSRDLALLGVLFNLVAIALEAANKLNLIAVPLLLEDASYLGAFEPQQRHTAAYFAYEMYQYGWGTSLMFFGGWCMVVGHLIRKSGFLPAVLGVALQIAGVCYSTNSFAQLVAPTVAGILFPAILLPALVAESSLSLWLLVKGIDIGKWAETVPDTHPRTRMDGAGTRSGITS